MATISQKLMSRDKIWASDLVKVQCFIFKGFENIVGSKLILREVGRLTTKLPHKVCTHLIGTPHNHHATLAQRPCTVDTHTGY